MPRRKVAARGHQAVYITLVVLWMQCEEMGLQLKNMTTLFHISPIKIDIITLQALIPILQMVKNANSYQILVQADPFLFIVPRFGIRYATSLGA